MSYRTHSKTNRKDYEDASLFKEFVWVINLPKHVQNEYFVKQRRITEGSGVGRMSERLGPAMQGLQGSMPAGIQYGCLPAHKSIALMAQRMHGPEQDIRFTRIEAERGMRYSGRSASEEGGAIMAGPSAGQNVPPKEKQGHCVPLPRRLFDRAEQPAERRLGAPAAPRLNTPSSAGNFEDVPAAPFIKADMLFSLSGRNNYLLRHPPAPGSSFDPPAAESKQSSPEEPFQLNETDEGFVCSYCEARYVYKRCLVNHLLKSHRKLMKNTKFPSFEL